MTELTDYLLVCFGTLFAVLSPIVTGILLSARAKSWLHYPVLVGTIMVSYLSTYYVLRIAVTYSNLFSEIARRTVTRLMGLLLASLAVQFVVNGIKDLDFV